MTEEIILSTTQTVLIEIGIFLINIIIFFLIFFFRKTATELQRSINTWGHTFFIYGGLSYKSILEAFNIHTTKPEVSVDYIAIMFVITFFLVAINNIYDYEVKILKYSKPKKYYK